MISPGSGQPPGGAEQSFISHLLELRDRLLRSILTVVVLLLALMPFSQEIYTLLARPLLSHLPKGTTMIATEVASPFLTPFKLTLILAIVLAMPMILYQLWAFVAPGLYQSERRIALPLVVSSALLFYLGMAFAYYVVFPLVFAFFTSSAPKGVTVMTDISKYLDFVLTLFFAFGVAFEVPVATVLLVWAGIVTPQSLASKRPYIIVAAFVIGMVLTPPDVISQTLLAIPMWMLFELGLLLSRWLVPARSENSADSRGRNTSPDDLEQEFRQAEAAERQLTAGPDGGPGHRPEDAPP
jgi:sec-independent protein translocase protein TatC